MVSVTARPAADEQEAPRALRLFDNVFDSRVERTLVDCEFRSCPAGEVLLRPGDVNESVHLVLSGELRVTLGDGGFAISPGECFGEMSAIDGGQATALVTASRDSRVAIIPQSLFWQRLITIPGVARNMLSMLVRRLRNANDWLLLEQRQRILYERLQQEMQAAREIQSSMMPSRLKLFPGRPEIDCAGAMFPAVDVAGDFFDACMVTDDQMFFAVGDVSGKGVSAALFMAKTVPLLRLEATRRGSVPEIVAAVNDALCENNHRCMFVTLGCGLLDLRTGELAYGNAGHLPPVVLRRGEVPRFLAIPEGITLGIMQYEAYDQCTTSLEPGDLLLLYSDGVTEAFNDRDEAFGPQRLLDALAGLGEGGATEIVGAVKAAVDAFADGAEQSDDIALFAVRYEGAVEQDVPGFTLLSG
ncbi:MAG TPA: SpoIIE family protein phosphatase [Usitatibacter sp.]|nr:SpoIIE family protein phosphatase [Usitatibacter sp.]